MEEGIGLKRPRPIVGDDEVEHPPQQRKPRFPKGKKLKGQGRLDVADGYDGDSNVQIGPNFAAKERAKRRVEKKETDLFGSTAEFTDFEVQYEDDSNFEADGVEIEPFNLQQEREEGYFDDNGNYVEYRREQEIKDAWLDSISADLRIAEKIPARQIPEGEYEDLSLEEIRTLKRRITDILQPGETIIHALKRLKGSSSDKRAKMSESTKLMFDQLTEAAMKLMENGEYNVYHQERETFEREIVLILDSLFTAAVNIAVVNIAYNTAVTDATPFNTLKLLLLLPSMHRCPNVVNNDFNTLVCDNVEASKEADKFDMFGDDDDNDGNENLQSDEATLGFTSSGQTTHSATERQEESENFASTQAVTGGSESDYVYDPSSGFCSCLIFSLFGYFGFFFTITVAPWAITTTLYRSFIAVPHQEYGTHLTSSWEHTLKSILDHPKRLKAFRNGMHDFHVER
ncbi:hypothetical protein IEQ34_026740 [Dendrobium chrysotoxum]|uniref:LIN1-like protein n=1 Tax=Dendrobium chrysotoxum TaxID=161865 RepID=A0AAV7FLK5_DENCH|nr:hypothetical protein IEQ34_026740 [Dendrobium chrysotoxum]